MRQKRPLLLQARMDLNIFSEKDSEGHGTQGLEWQDSPRALPCPLGWSWQLEPEEEGDPHLRPAILGLQPEVELVWAEAWGPLHTGGPGDPTLAAHAWEDGCFQSEQRQSEHV